MQLKEQSTWFFAPCKELPMAAVHDFMGSFSTITCVAKLAARMGQCFSSTVETVEVTVRHNPSPLFLPYLPAEGWREGGHSQRDISSLEALGYDPLYC